MKGMVLVLVLVGVFWKGMFLRRCPTTSQLATGDGKPASDKVGKPLSLPEWLPRTLQRCFGETEAQDCELRSKDITLKSCRNWTGNLFLRHFIKPKT